MSVERDLGAMLRDLRPERRPGRYVFATVEDLGSLGRTPVMTFAEDEGLTAILEQDDADAAGLRYDVVLAWITLRVHSALEGVGLTAAVSGALAHAGISCNVVAAVHHDHLFVPEASATEAMAVLEALSAAACLRQHTPQAR